MDTYIDIRLLPDPEFTTTTLMNALFAKFHRALVQFRAGSIGASFPDAGGATRTLGARLRLHGTHDVLARFNRTNWLQGMRDHVTQGALTPVPQNVRHRNVRRVQIKSSVERERRRLILRKGVSEEEAIRLLPDSREKMCDLPYLMMTSASTGQQFRLFVDQTPPRDQAQDGVFSAYGLSSEATIPWF